MTNLFQTSYTELAMTAPKKRDIELLPREDWEKTSFGKLLKWVLTVGRYILIATELIVILAFLSRFKLDRDLTNLHEEIKEKQAKIEASSDFEEEFRFLQKRLASIEGLEKKQVVTAGVLEELSALIPLDVSLTDLSVSDKEVSLTATALSEQGLASFLNNLKSSDKFENLVLTQVVSGTEKGVGIQFDLTSEFREQL